MSLITFVILYMVAPVLVGFIVAWLVIPRSINIIVNKHIASKSKGLKQYRRANSSIKTKW